MSEIDKLEKLLNSEDDSEPVHVLPDGRVVKLAELDAILRDDAPPAEAALPEGHDKEAADGFDGLMSFAAGLGYSADPAMWPHAAAIRNLIGSYKAAVADVERLTENLRIRDCQLEGKQRALNELAHPATQRAERAEAALAEAVAKAERPFDSAVPPTAEDIGWAVKHCEDRNMLWAAGVLRACWAAIRSRPA